MRAVVLNNYGDLSNVSVVDLDAPKKMTSQDVYISNVLSGVTVDDVSFIKGDITKDPSFSKSILGFSGIANIIKAGSESGKLTAGARVGYIVGAPGSYAEKRVIHNTMLIGVPDQISDDTAAACLRDGAIAEILLLKAVNARKNDFIIICGVETGPGHILAQWARSLDLKVIGIVDSEQKKLFCSKYCDHIYINSPEAIGQIIDITNGMGASIAYDGIGGDCFDTCISCLKRSGIYVSFFNGKKSVGAEKIEKLMNKSIFFTRPYVEDYYSNKAEIAISMNNLFQAVIKGSISVHINKFKMNDIASVLKKIELGESVGSCIIQI